MAMANPAGAKAKDSPKGASPGLTGLSTFRDSREIDVPLSAMTNFPQKMSNLGRRRRRCPAHNAAPMVKNRLADLQGCGMTIMWTDGRTGDATGTEYAVSSYVVSSSGAQGCRPIGPG